MPHHFRGIGLDPVPAFLAPDMNRTRATAAFPSIIGWPGSDFT